MDALNSFAGLVLIAAPWILRYSDNRLAMWTSVVLGVVILVVAGYRALAKDAHRWEEWTVAIVGAVAVMIPFAFGYAGVAVWASITLGAVITAAALYQLTVTSSPRRRPAH